VKRINRWCQRHQ